MAELILEIPPYLFKINKELMKYKKNSVVIPVLAGSPRLGTKKIASTQSRTEDRYITSVAPYQLGHRSLIHENKTRWRTLYVFR